MKLPNSGVLLVLASIFSTPATAQNQTIQPAIVTETPINGVSTTPEGRIFLLYARVDLSSGPQVVEYFASTNTTKPIPDEEWNSYTTGADPTTHLIRTNSQRIGPDGALWLVDTGSPSFGAPVILPDGPKLVQFNLTSNTVQRVYPMGNLLRSNSLLDDVRFNPMTGKAYLTDAGSPGLIVLDLASGEGVRVLNDHPSTTAFFPVSAKGAFVHAPDGGGLYIHADQLEVSPDGVYFYYQPSNGGMSRIKTEYLEEAFSNSSFNSNEIVEQYIEPYALTPSGGGTAIDAQGNIYVSDTDRFAIEKVSPDGTRRTLVQDDRLTWVDAMWVGSDEKLYMPAAQLNRGAPFNNGSTSRLSKPLYVWTLGLGVGPSEIDHA